MKIWRIAVLVVCLIAGCGGGTSVPLTAGPGSAPTGPAEPSAPVPPLANPDLVEQMVGPDGGTLTSTDGLLVMTIPANALRNDIEIGIETLSDMALLDAITEVTGPLSEGLPVGGGYRFTPEGTQFDLPVEIGLTQSNVVVDQGGALISLPYILSLSGGEFSVPLSAGFPGGMDRQLIVQIEHFSEFIQVEESGASFMVSSNPEQLLVGESGTIRVAGGLGDVSELGLFINELDSSGIVPVIGVSEEARLNIVSITNSNPDVLALNMSTLIAPQDTRLIVDQVGNTLFNSFRENTHTEAYTCIAPGSASVTLEIELAREEGIFNDFPARFNPTKVSAITRLGPIECLQAEPDSLNTALISDLGTTHPEAVTFVLGDNELTNELIAVAGTPLDAEGVAAVLIDPLCTPDLDNDCVVQRYSALDGEPKFDAIAHQGQTQSGQLSTELLVSGVNFCSLTLEADGSLPLDDQNVAGCFLFTGTFVDASLFNGRTDASLQVNGSVEPRVFNPDLGFTPRAPLSDIFSPVDTFNASAVSAVANNDGSAYLVALDTGEMLYVQVDADSSPRFSVQSIGMLAATDPRRLRCGSGFTNSLCAVSDFTAEQIQLIEWNGIDTPVIRQTVLMAPGGPVGIDVQGLKIAATGFNNNRAYRFELDESNPFDISRAVTTEADFANIRAASGCTQPGHALMLGEELDVVLVSCNGSDSLLRLSGFEFIPIE